MVLHPPPMQGLYVIKILVLWMLLLDSTAYCDAVIPVGCQKDPGGSLSQETAAEVN
jgi:hypothetical protein